MKRCPECRRDYYDDSLLYCLDDGAALLEGPARDGVSGDEPRTAILHETAGPSDDAVTRQQDLATDQTAVLPSGVAETKVVDKRLPLAVLALALIVLGGFFGYRYSWPSKQIESIAVMPLVNQSGNPDADYLTDGLAESLIFRLSQLPGLKVSPVSSVIRYKGKDFDAQKIARELGVRAVMSGRMAQRGDNLTIS